MLPPETRVRPRVDPSDLAGRSTSPAAAEGPDGAEAARAGAEGPQTDEVLLAAVAGAHGVAGEVRLKVFAENLAAFTSFNGGSLTLTALRPAGGGMIARFAEVCDRTQAEALRGTALRVPRAALPQPGEGEIYVADLLGLAVVSTAGEDVGRVVAVENYGAGDVIEVERRDGRRFMAPFNREAVPQVGTQLVLDQAFVV